MELYTLDSSFQRSEVIDEFESCIWTERRTAFGEFEILAYDNLRSRELLKNGSYLMRRGSNRVMEIKDIHVKNDEDDRRMMLITGLGLEHILQDRMAMEKLNTDAVRWNLATNPKLQTGNTGYGTDGSSGESPTGRVAITDLGDFEFAYGGTHGSMPDGRVKRYELKGLKAGNQYTVGVFVKSSGAANFRVSADSNLTSPVVDQVSTNNNSWHRRSATFTANADTMYVGLRKNGAGAGSLWITAIVCEPGVQSGTYWDGATPKDVMTVGMIQEWVGQEDGSKSIMKNPTVWNLKGKPADVVRQIFNHICLDGALSVHDKIPNLVDGPSAAWGEGLEWEDADWTWNETGGSWSASMFPEDSLPGPQEEIEFEIKPAPLYSVIQEICETHDLGFRLVRTLDESGVYFEVYAGSDRTTGQDDLDPVVFSPGLDTLDNTAELYSTINAKNVAYVISEQGSEVVYADDVDPSIDGFERRVLTVNITSIDSEIDTPEKLSAYLIQQGKNELSKHKPVTAFDGEVVDNGRYVEGRDYYIGDVVEFRNDQGLSVHMRVTENITSSDAEGDRSYPTLAIKSLITDGTWESWIGRQEWDTVTGEWTTQ